MSYLDVNVEPTVEAVASIVAYSGTFIYSNRGAQSVQQKLSVVAFVMNIV